MRRRAWGVCAMLVFALTGCAGGAATVPPSTTPSTAEQALWHLRSGEQKRCSEAWLVDRIAKAKASNVESTENSVLETPDELDRSVVADAQYREQIDEWKKLTPDDRIYQLCLAVDQHFDRS